MPLSLKELNQVSSIDKLIIHSLDPHLYQASVEIDGEESIIEDSDGSLLRSRSLSEMKTLFSELPIQSSVLRQVSAYDEMINQEPKFSSNLMEVPLKLRSDA